MNFREVIKEMSKIKILFLASVPSTTQQTELLEQERRIIESILAAARYRKWFGDYVYRNVLEFDDFEQYLKDVQPTIFHFSGHGHANGELKLGERYIPVDFLARVFADASTYVKCATLSSCYSEKQAEEIAKSVPCVVGTKYEILHQSALKFVESFYREIGDGRTINTAYEKARSLVNARAAGLEENMILLPKEDSGKDLILVPPSRTTDLTNALEAVQSTGEEGNKKGSLPYSEFYRFDLLLEEVVVSSYLKKIETDGYVQKYIIDGRWSSAVIKERWSLNPITNRPFLVDTPWGPNKKPKGSFTAEVQTTNGILQSSVVVNVSHGNEEADEFVAKKIELLIKLKIKEAV